MNPPWWGYLPRLMSTAQPAASTSSGVVQPKTLREALEVRRVRGERFSLREAIGIMVPLTTQIAGLHAAGRRFYVHPSAIEHGKSGSELVVEWATSPPTHDHDRSCLAPEERKGPAGDSRASVFSIGAIFYELITGEPVGPGMKRPSEAVPNLPSSAEVLLGKALVADPKHRPADLAALAQALYSLAPNASMPPPDADVSHLDHDEGFDVDVSLSMLPPAPSGFRAPAALTAPAAAPSTPFTVVDAQAPESARHVDDPTERLAALKDRLESDTRPRYIVIKDGMDHGPFTAVELLQQIASHNFMSAHRLRDTMSDDEREIANWPEFSPFAEQAKLHRDIKQEKRALEAVVVAEKRGMQYKTLIGAAVLGLIAAAALGWWARERANSKRDQVVHGDEARNIEVDAGLGTGKDGKPGVGGGKFTGGGSGSFPQIAGGGSCEAAQAKYVEEFNLQGGNGKPDLGAADFGNVLNSGGYLNSCGVPSNMGVDICVAVQNGRAVGVTVRTNPSNPGIAGCIRGRVGGLSFPAHPRMDIARTSFAAQ
jgi:eukaryotic-like serine/threonine-protein kinase